MMEGLTGRWDVSGLPDGWPEMVADALSELDDQEFESAWELLGKAIRLRSRRLRREMLWAWASDG